jgi:hypothetical protein
MAARTPIGTNPRVGRRRECPSHRAEYSMFTPKDYILFGSKSGE